jgi:hypothetical protein
MRPTDRISSFQGSFYIPHKCFVCSPFHMADIKTIIHSYDKMWSLFISLVRIFMVDKCCNMYENIYVCVCVRVLLRQF